MPSIDSRAPLLAAAVALRRQDGKVLLLQHKNLIPFPKKWSFPVAVVSESETEKLMEEYRNKFASAFGKCINYRYNF